MIGLPSFKDMLLWLPRVMAPWVLRDFFLQSHGPEFTRVAVRETETASPECADTVESGLCRPTPVCWQTGRPADARLFSLELQ